MVKKNENYLKRILSLLLFTVLFFSVQAVAALPQEKVVITQNNQLVDTFNGVEARYALSNSDSDTYYSCAAFVKRYYQAVYGVTVSNMFSGKTPNASKGSFSVASNPQIGDIGYTPGHWFILKEINGDGTYTIIEQNYKFTVSGSICTYKNRHVAASSVTVFRWSEKNGTVGLDKTSLTVWPGDTSSIHANLQNVRTETLKWSSDDGNVVSVSNGAITAKKVGTAHITAALVDTSGNTVSESVCAVTVKQPTIKLNYTTATVYGNETLQLKATVEGPSQTVTWKCSSSLYLSVDKNGLVKMGSMETLRNVSATITATANGVSATCKVTRVPGIIKFASDSVSMSAGGTRTVSVTKRGVSSVKYSSSNTAIATVNSSTGKVTAKKEGTVKITAAGGGVSASCTVKVSPTVKLNMSSATLYKGQTKKLTATVKGSSAKKKWKSSNSSVVSVSSSGKIKAKKAGTAKITVTIKGKNGTVSAACKVTVKKPTISLNKTSVTIKKGSTLSLKATVKGSSQKVTWKSSNKKVATVKNGKVTAKKAGTVTITAKANGVTAKCKVTVKNVPVTIKLSASSLTVYKGNTAALKATVTGSNSSVKWSSSNAAVASVSSKGKITGKSKGSTVITAKIGNVKAQCTVTVKLKSVSQRKTIDVAKYLRQDPSVAIAATGATPIYSSGSWRAVRDRGFVNSSYYTTLECAEFYSLSNSNKDGKINRIYLYMNRAASQESEIQEGDYSINGVYVNMKKEDAETVLENNGWKAVTLKELINLYQVDTDYNMYDRDYYIKKNDVMVLSESYDHYGRINTVSLYTREKMIEKLENS